MSSPRAANNPTAGCADRSRLTEGKTLEESIEGGYRRLAGVRVPGGARRLRGARSDDSTRHEQPPRYRYTSWEWRIVEPTAAECPPRAVLDALVHERRLERFSGRGTLMYQIWHRSQLRSEHRPGLERARHFAAWKGWTRYPGRPIAELPTDAGRVPAYLLAAWEDMATPSYPELMLEAATTLAQANVTRAQGRALYEVLVTSPGARQVTGPQGGSETEIRISLSNVDGHEFRVRYDRERNRVPFLAVRGMPGCLPDYTLTLKRTADVARAPKAPPVDRERGQVGSA